MLKKLLYAICAIMTMAMVSCDPDVLVNGDKDRDKDKDKDNPNQGFVDDNNGNQSSAEPIVLAYVPYWTSKMPLAANTTHINYAFAELYVKGGVYTGFKLQGNQSTFQKVVDMKKTNPKLKILLSFTNLIENSDNSVDGGFSDLAANEKYRKQFAKDCVAFMQRWDIDGIDIDWEFPGLAWGSTKKDPAKDTHNYTLLMKDLREAFGKSYMLTFAGYCMDKVKVSSGYQYIDLAAVEPYVDYVCVMTYDLDAAPHFQSALSSPSSYWDIKRTVASYKKAGFPMEKVVLGIPFYARHAWSGTSASLSYSKIQSLGSGYVIDNWDDDAQTPYITYNGTFWGSYDNEISIDVKAKYGAAEGMKGLFYWSIYDDDASYTLSKAMWKSVKKHF